MIVLDGKRMTDRAALHAELRQKLALPDYYGNNLDAVKQGTKGLAGRPVLLL